MDKYEYNLKLEEIDKLVDQADYEEAAKLADTIDWRRVRNIRTLCLISEIYEASGRLEDSKTLLMRAYKKSPVGKTILYRLVEVTTALQQYDEAIEFYSEYVQAAPHDTNRYILKYRLYRGRGSSADELIAILEEYLGQEYTERWAYELAVLYQQAGYMQKCYAACDDLVLWFHSGKYVKKALELKKRYTALTPKQQQIYEECLQEEFEAQDAAYEYEDETTVVQEMDEIAGEVITESIMAETEKEIAGEVAARKAEMEREAEEIASASGISGAAAAEAVLQETKVLDTEAAKAAVQTDAASEAQTVLPEAEPNAEAKELNESFAAGAEAAQDEQKDLKVEFAKSMRKIIAGVVKRTMENEDDIPASVETNVQPVHKLEIPEVEEPSAGKLSIDDILLAMGEKGKAIAAEAQRMQEKAEQEAAANAAAEAKRAEEEQAAREAAQKEAAAQEPAEETVSEPMKTMTEAVAEDLTEAQREALQYTSNPERLLRNKRALPTYSEDVLSEKTIRIPTEKISEFILKNAAEEEAAMQAEKKAAQEALQESVQTEAQESGDSSEEMGWTEEVTEETPGESEEQEAAEAAPGESEEQEATEETLGESEEQEATEEALGESEEPKIREAEFVVEEIAVEPEEESAEYEYFDEQNPQEYEEEYLMIPDHLRGLFRGFTEVEGLEDQIANAIIQAQAKGTDRTSRSGNILIFGAHGSGKTTLAMNIAKAIAQDKGSQVMKIAKIYAADLNRKDIAATIARIAGGTLIIEEAGDLEPKTVEQLTTAMEFRTDGLVVILEDEQQYVHELLIRHPRFTMKFTAQIYIPVYTAEELAMFGQIYANEQDYVIGEDGLEALYEKISAAAASGEGMAIADVIGIVAAAIGRSNKFLRKLTMGKKRYDDNDYVVLYAKDFR